VPRREVFEHQGALGPDLTEETRKDRVIMAVIIQWTGRKFNAHEVDGISERHRASGRYSPSQRNEDRKLDA
jgi:hypothetical protein